MPKFYYAYATTDLYGDGIAKLNEKKIEVPNDNVPNTNSFVHFCFTNLVRGYPWSDGD